MDQELLAYFERKFADIDRRFSDIDRRFDEAREQQRADLEAFRQEVNGRFVQIDGRFEQIDGRFVQIDGRFERLEDEVRHGFVAIEDLRDRIQTVAEGVSGVTERLERFQDENAKEHAEIRGLIKTSYTQLDERVTRLEKRVAGGRTR